MHKGDSSNNINPVPKFAADGDTPPATLFFANLDEKFFKLMHDVVEAQQKIWAIRSFWYLYLTNELKLETDEEDVPMNIVRVFTSKPLNY